MLRPFLRTVLSSLAETVCGSDAPRVLYYHRIDTDRHRSCVHPIQFARQMEYLATHEYRVVPLDAMYHDLAAGRTPPQRSVALSFDDGFADNYTQAFPILQQYDFPATIFLTVNFIGTKGLPVLTDKGYVPAPLSWEQVAEMDRSSMTFGSHTLTHPTLSQVSRAEVKKEVCLSRTILQEKLGHDVSLFCYPRGAFTQEVKEAVCQAGYYGACSILPGAIQRDSDRYALPRTYIGQDDTVEDFRKKLRGAYDVLHAGVQLWRRVSPRQSKPHGDEAQIA